MVCREGYQSQREVVQAEGTRFGPEAKKVRVAGGLLAASGFVGAWRGLCREQLSALLAAIVADDPKFGLESRFGSWSCWSAPRRRDV